MKRVGLMGIACVLLAGVAFADDQTPAPKLSQDPPSRGLVLPLPPMPKPVDMKPLQGFSIVLLLGEAQGTAVPEGLSAPAKKALADVKDFLPYKGYRVLDTGWAGHRRTPSYMPSKIRTTR